MVVVIMIVKKKDKNIKLIVKNNTIIKAQLKVLIKYRF